MVYLLNMVIFYSYVKLPEGMKFAQKNGNFKTGIRWNLMHTHCKRESMTQPEPFQPDAPLKYKPATFGMMPETTSTSQPPQIIDTMHGHGELLPIHGHGKVDPRPCFWALGWGHLQKPEESSGINPEPGA